MSPRAKEAMFWVGLLILFFAAFTLGWSSAR